MGDISKTGKIRIRVIVDGQIQSNTNDPDRSPPTSTSATGQLVVGGPRPQALRQQWVGYIDNVMVMQGLLDDAALVQLDATDGGRCYLSPIRHHGDHTMRKLTPTRIA